MRSKSYKRDAYIIGVIAAIFITMICFYVLYIGLKKEPIMVIQGTYDTINT